MTPTAAIDWDGGGRDVGAERGGSWKYDILKSGGWINKVENPAKNGDAGDVDSRLVGIRVHTFNLGLIASIGPICSSM